MANSVSIKDDGAVTVSSDEKLLSLYDQALKDALATGHAYTVFGSRQVTHTDIRYLEQMRDKYEARCMSKRGVIPRNHADFSGSDASLSGDVAP